MGLFQKSIGPGLVVFRWDWQTVDGRWGCRESNVALAGLLRPGCAQWRR
jgi:hypothetical protein